MSKQRFTKLSSEVKRDPEGRRLCRFCPNPVPKGRRSWCSQACVERYLIQSSSSWARRAVHKRDKGVCAVCGTDTDAIRAHLRYLQKHSYGTDPISMMFTNAYRALKEHLRTQYNAARTPGDFWQADHIKPVCEGGGEAGLEGYRTLCTPCHKAETAKLAARRAQQRKSKPVFDRILTPSFKLDSSAENLRNLAKLASTMYDTEGETNEERDLGGDQGGASSTVVRGPTTDHAGP